MANDSGSLTLALEYDAAVIAAGCVSLAIKAQTKAKPYKLVKMAKWYFFLSLPFLCSPRPLHTAPHTYHTSLSISLSLALALALALARSLSRSLSRSRYRSFTHARLASTLK